MSYIPHTHDEISTMLATIGVNSIDELFNEIPSTLRCDTLANIPTSLTEIEVNRLLRRRAAQNTQTTCFMGAGAYEHHIPAPIWEIASRGEFYSAYTPYQAEASQGTLQLLYEFQTMMANLTAMEAANASLYDGASALAEAVLMAVRLHKKAKRILMPLTVHPTYRRVVETIVKNQEIQLIDVPYLQESGIIDPEILSQYNVQEIAALVIPYPNFFGCLEAVDALTTWAQTHGIFVIAVVNPIALALLSPPGEWGSNKGADIVCGEGQPLGIPLSAGGPYLGFMCCKKTHIRQMPGRIVGRTTDLEGHIGYTLTLQAREQHIRRSKATSNICTNQGLMVTAATIYLSLLGAIGLKQVASSCHHHTTVLVDQLTAISGVKRAFTTPYFHETVLQLKVPVDVVLQKLAEQGILGGYNLTQNYPELPNSMLVCATEMRTLEEIEHYATQLERIFMSYE